MRYSSKREAIWDWIKDRHDHPTAEQVFEAVKETQPGIGLATVYRNLLVLEEQGKLQSVDVGDGVAHFDPVAGAHPHFKCSICGQVLDVEADCTKALADIELAGIGEVESYSLCFYGVCADCAQAKSA